VIGPLKRGLFGAVLVWSSSVTNARAAALHVFLAPPPAAGEAGMQSISAELEQYGYAVSWASDATSPCMAGARDRAKPPGVWISVGLDAGSHQTLATICFWGSGASPELVSIAAPIADHRQLALATLEALNGLSAAPIVRVRFPAPAASDALASAPSSVRDAASAAWLVQTSLAFDVFGGPPVIGAGVALDTPLDGALSLELDSFIPLRASVERGEQRELSLNVAWLRLGPRLSWQLAPVRLGASVDAGAALVWVKARTTPPLIGSVEVAPAGIVSSGVWLEYPDESPLFFRVGCRVSRLLPSIELELGTGTARPFGEFLIDSGIGFGLRWDRAR
jgi:hypothetical protein